MARSGSVSRTSVLKILAFGFGYVMFAALGTITSVLSFVLSIPFHGPRTRRIGQKQIHYLFRFFVWYLERCRLLNVDGDELYSLRERRNVILVANHPSLLDAVFVSRYLSNIFCLMKASLVHNIVMCGQARLAGYVNNRSAVGLVKSCRSRLAEGSNLLVFPEGTRTRGALGAFKMGFALVSHATGAPIQTLVIRYDHNYLGKNWKFFRPPPFPLNCSLKLGKVFEPGPFADGRALGQAVEEYLRCECDPRVSAAHD